MIVMKFGGTSVESAAALERVTGIVKSRLDRKPVVVVSAMGKTTNRLLKIANLAVSGKREEALGELVALRDFHLRESGMERTVDEHFQDLTELVKGLAVLGELTPRSIDGRRGDGQQLVGGLAHGGDHDHGLAISAGFDDGGDALDGCRRFDRSAAEFHDDHQSSIPSECISSALSTAAPAAPRTVLCPSATNL